MVIGLIKNQCGNILLQKRIDALIPAANEKWEFPGGRVEFGELPEEALVREAREEVGCTISKCSTTSPTCSVSCLGKDGWQDFAGFCFML